MLPPFTPDGLLPLGSHDLTFSDLRASFLIAGQETFSQNWDSKWRSQLVDNLEVLVNQLWGVGITEIIIDGSFVEEKDHPNDIDGYFVCDVTDYDRVVKELGRMDPFIWDWNIHDIKGHEKFNMWHVLKVELYIVIRQAPNDMPSFFRATRDGRIKGVVNIIK